MLTALFLFFSVSEWTGLDPARDYEAALGGVLIAIITGALAGGGVIYLRQINNPVRPKRQHRLPHAGSSARQPMRRLAEVETTLDDLLDQIDDPRLPPGWAERTRHAVANTSQELRAIAARIQAVERAIDHARWQWERETLAEGVLEMLGHIDRGLAGYQQLVIAAGQALVASATTTSMDELTDATEHLASLAHALRELPDHGR